VIVKEALANGRLTARGNSLLPDKHKEVLNTLAQKYGVGWDALALAFVQQQSWAGSVLSGATTQDQLAENLQGSSVSLNPEEFSLLSSLTLEPEEYWSARSALAWN
jgi:aryl-alcohol dehydrogenase-like predicted oxidoreductase